MIFPFINTYLREAWATIEGVGLSTERASCHPIGLLRCLQLRRLLRAMKFRIHGGDVRCLCTRFLRLCRNLSLDELDEGDEVDDEVDEVEMRPLT